MTKQEEIQSWLTNELDDWLENIADAYKATDDSVAVSPEVVAKLILMGLADRDVVIKVDYKIKYSTAIPAGTELVAVEPLIGE